MKRLTLVTALAAVLAFGVAVPSAHAASFQVVVHESNPVRSLSVDQVSDLFLKKVTRWDDGSEVVPVDQNDDSSVRATFSEEIHDRSVSAIKSYWQRLIFSGRGTPPPELGGDAEVLAFVRSKPGAIGYVSAGAAVPDGLAVVKVGN